ncbi:MAG: archaeal proteasome endopeptidase complex subunit alpha [Thermoprotei archaeon]
MFSPPSMGYDRAITIFSPDGRLYQVEYAIEAVRRGYTTLGIRCADGVLLMAERRKIALLIDENTIEKIWKIDDNIGIAYAGLAPDARVLMEEARTAAQIHRILYDEPIPIEELTVRISNIKQFYTLHAGARPFGVAFLIGGVDEKRPVLMSTDPGGAYAGYYAHALGAGSQTVLEVLEKEWYPQITLQEGLKLGLKAMAKVIEGELTPQKLEIATIDVKTGLFRKFTYDEVSKIIEEFKGTKS